MEKNISVVEKALLEIVDLIRSFIRTFLSLIIKGDKVLRSMEPEYAPSEKYFNPIVFFIFSTFLSFTLGVEKYYNVFNEANIPDLAKMFPSFTHETSLLDIVIYTSPVILTCYVASELLSRILRVAPEWRKVYRNYMFYSFALLQLLIFTSLLLIFIIDKIKPTLAIRLVNGKLVMSGFEVALLVTEFIIIALSFILSIVLPIGVISEVLFKKHKLLFFQFLTIPILVPFFYVLSERVNNTVVTYRETSRPKESIDFAFPSSFPDTKSISVGYKKYSDTVQMTINMNYYNPTQEILYIPETIDFSSKLVNDTSLGYIVFSAIPLSDTNWENPLNRLLIKPREAKIVDYNCLLPQNRFSNVMKLAKDTDSLQNKFNLTASYYNFKGQRLYINGNYRFSLYERLPVDSLKRVEKVFVNQLKIIINRLNNKSQARK